MATVRSAPSFEVTLGGKTYKQADSQGLEQVILEDHVDMVNMLTVRLSGAEQSPEWTAEIGQKVTAKFGAGSVESFTGEVISVEPSWTNRGGATLTVRCYDNTHRLGRGRKTRWFKDLKDSEIVQQVGSECGLDVQADPTEEKHEYTLQRNESNLAFLKRLAARNNFQLAVRDGALQFKAATTSTTATEIKMGDNMRSLSMNFNTTEMASEVVVRGWDIRTKTEIEGRATVSDSPNIGGGSKGSQIASQHFGEHTVTITDVPVTNQTQAQMLAKAEFQRQARQFGRGTCTVDGNDQLRAGAMVKFSGVSNGYNGNYYIVSSRHIVSAYSGYITEVTFCSDTMGE